MQHSPLRLTAAQLKWLALFCMVLDHVAYFFSLSVTLRWVGRLAAPIFLYLVVEGFCHTHDLKKYLLRMYAVALFMGLANALLARFAGTLRPDGLTPENSICAMFFVLLVILTGIRLCEKRQVLWGLLTIAAPFSVTLLAFLLLPQETAPLLLTTLLPSPLLAEGGMQFICLGVLLYLFRSSRKTQLIVFFLFSVSCNILLFLPQLGTYGAAYFLYGYYQWMEIFAIVPLALYSGERGRCPRWFFYVFYPTHIYVLWFLSTVL